MDGGEKVAGSFIIAGGDATELFKFGKEILDQMTRFVYVFVIRAWVGSVTSGWHHCCFSRLLQRFDEACMRIISLVSNDYVRLYAGQQLIRAV